MKFITTIALLFAINLCFSQTSFDVKDVDGKTVVVQNTTSEVVITSTEINRQITELKKQRDAIIAQINIFNDLYRKVKAIEEKNKPELPKEAPKN